MMRSLSSEEHDLALAEGRHPDCAVWTVEARQQRDLAERHGLRALPSIVIYREGLPARRFAGGMSADELGQEVDEVAAADLEAEFNDWMLWMLETGEAGSPFIGSHPNELNTNNYFQD